MWSGPLQPAALANLYHQVQAAKHQSQPDPQKEPTQ